MLCSESNVKKKKTSFVKLRYIYKLGIFEIFTKKIIKETTNDNIMIVG